MTADILLLRHGQTEANRDRIWQGFQDWPLTELGLAQARAVARRLARYELAALYSSDLGRAMQTAQTIAAASTLDIVVRPALRERGLGVFEGLHTDDIQALHPEVWQSFRSGDPDYVIPGGESARQRLQRVLDCLDEIAAAHEGQTVTVITHGGVLAGFLRHVLGIPQDRDRRFSVHNCALNHFRRSEDGWHLLTWGDMAHLDHAGA